MNEVMFSSKKDDWTTPQELFDELNRKFNFVLDACASQSNAKCAEFFSAQNSCLDKDWPRGAVFMNPPYGRNIGAFVKKAYEESMMGSTVVCLLPARTDTRWWHDYVSRGSITFIKGRLKFGESRNSAPFPSAIVVFYGKAGAE